jgi:uncharacterized membrane protein YphA (DoxX/SURF4 family)
VSPLRALDATGLPLLLARLVVGGMFAWLALPKIARPGEFLKEIHTYAILPETPPQLLNLTAVAMPWIELMGGLALLLGILVRGSGAVLATMLIAFTAAISSRALSIHNTQGTPLLEVAFDCGCGTGLVIIWKKVLINIGLIVLSLLAAWSNSRRWCLSALFSRRARTPTSTAPALQPTPAAK